MQTKTQSAFWKAIQANLKSQHQAVAIQPVSRTECLPLSFAQERLWRVEQFQPGSPGHHLCAVFRLQGRLDVTALQKSIQLIVDRHESLRTTFVVVDGKPVQRIAEQLKVSLPLEPLSEQSNDEVAQLVTKEAGRPFHLETGPLLRLKLYRLNEDEHLFVKVIHHLINDRWSDSVFLRELATAYEQLSAGKAVTLSPLPIQYADFAYSQRQTLQGMCWQEKLDFWRDRLQGKLQTVALPTDYPPAAGSSDQGAAQSLLFSGQLSTALKAYSRESGLSLFVVLVTAYQVLLSRASGQEDLVLCCPVAGRQQVETKKLIGYFNNMILLRTQLPHTASFQDVAAQVADFTAAAFEHQDLPLQHIAKDLRLPGPLLSRTMFSLQNVPSRPLKLGNIDINQQDLNDGISNFDLSLSIKNTPDGLKGVMRYKVDLFRDETIDRLLGAYELLLERVMISPKIKLDDLPVFHGGSMGSKGIDRSYTAPRSSLEQTIAQVWQIALGLEKVDIHTTFAELGGRSLTLIQVQAELQTILEREILATDLFTYATVAKLAQYLQREEGTDNKNLALVKERSARQQAAMKRKKNRVMQLRRN